MSKAKMAASNGRGEYRDPSVGRRGDLPQDNKKRTRKHHAPNYYVYRSTSRVDLLEADHPGVRALVESLLRRRVRQTEISRQVFKRFGVRLSGKSLSHYYVSRIQPQEYEEAAAFRQAHAQARALIEEMKADPSLDAAQIAEIMLANQIVQDRSKLAEADIMDLYREQRERRKLELQHRALLLKEKQTRAVLEKLKGRQKSRVLPEQLVREIREIYGLSEPSPAAEAPGPESGG